MATTTYLVSGMHCDHCVSSVTEELSRLDAVSAVRVDLNPAGESRVTVSSETPLEESAVREAISEAGYALTGVAG
jgi:copper chaperone